MSLEDPPPEVKSSPTEPQTASWRSYFTEEEIAAATRVFKTYAESPDLKRHASESPEIAALFAAAKLALNPSTVQLKQRRKDALKRKRDDDREALAVSGIRQMRKVKAVGYSGGAVDIPLPPMIGSKESNAVFIKQQAEAEGSNVRTAGSTLQNTLSLTSSVAESSGNDCTEPGPFLPPPRKLNSARKCHICGAPFEYLHHFYDAMCGPCADFNFMKRFSTADMTGRVCVVTGARVKIGYTIALRLLRMGAHVIATTRFPHDAADRYSKEADFQSFSGRLSIFGLDFRDVGMLHHFAAHLKLTYGRLDVLINNAAQTVRRPPSYFAHLLEIESKPVPDAVRKTIDVVDAHRTKKGGYSFHHAAKELSDGSSVDGMSAESENNEIVAIKGSLGQDMSLNLPHGIHASAALSQLNLIDGDRREDFPPGLFDRDDQQVDLRKENSWVQSLGQITTVEMMECHAINAFAPWVLISELKGLMEVTKKPGWNEGEDEEWDKYIVNVSAMEGQFYRTKTFYHPHTNMAKASLNMLTRTSSVELAQMGIYMTSSDTGWITDEKPVDEWDRRVVPPPLDEWDAASRILDPVMCGVRGEEKLWGVFLKNYKPTRW